ncbi:hypothetical protein C0995_005927 [Termitomyces sp. Mi166|nr:hypothetical protein C0995_005927 [Termitomyces sp. Mi166\
MAASRSNDCLNKTSIDVPPHLVVHLDVARTSGSRTLAVSSSEWQQLRADILTRDNNTCSSCGYTSPDDKGRGMKVDHKDGDASNNHPSNLRLYCPPCEAIRHCGLHGLYGYIILGSSDLDQLEIIRRTREVFESSGTIPRVTELDPHAIRPNMSIVDFANLLLEKDWDNLPEKYRSFKGFFTNRADKLFSNLKSDDALHSDSNIRAEQILDLESSLPWMIFSPQEHTSLQNFLDTWPPSTTRLFEYACICVVNSKASLDDRGASDVEGLISAWEDSCANQHASATELDLLARRYNVLGGKWVLLAERDKVDALWSRIARSTHAGTLGTEAKVLPSDESSDDRRHVIRISTKDYTDFQDVKRVRESLRRLGIKGKIGYKPNAYTACSVYSNNPWNIRPTKYQM